ncbi:response regulator transcription factor [Maribellus sp. CM-23]|uniref:LytR/AlgR family response regulator transcription factor n=1 Tax=Maribellus sp. CM-23 TaxID=2781026 RepID=UPI001F1E5109|nr:LytTR family DNA-binding domain-containing protein [Maribellus sp. CM-23]MCE4563756.1 response regulator transcription factor [Maribellus sp. CM-23]
MTSYNAIIIDDEINVQQALQLLVGRYCPEITICGAAGSGSVGRELLKKHDVHLIFLDISMPGENGFEFLSTIPKENYAIIFTTAYEEYALRAIKANAIDYLLKPIDPMELKEAVAKATSHLDLRRQNMQVQQTYGESLENLAEQTSGGVEFPKKITVVEKFGFQIIEAEKIKYLEADANYCIIHISGLEKIVSSKSLGEFEKILDPDVFFRIHKSTIINMNYLKGFSSYQGAYAILDDNTKLAISRRRAIEFKEAVGHFSKSVD